MDRQVRTFKGRYRGVMWMVGDGMSSRVGMGMGMGRICWAEDGMGGGRRRPVISRSTTLWR